MATSVLYFSFFAGLLGIVAGLRRQGVSGSYWGVLAVGELLFIGQGILGLIMWVGGTRPSEGIHILYGVVTGFALPAYFSISKGRDDHRAALSYGLLCLFLSAMTVIRTISTG